MNDGALLDAVAAEAGWMEELLVSLVEAPTTLGNEEPGQRVMEEALADCGLKVRSVPLDADALRSAEGASPFSWDVSGKRNVVADWPAGGGGGRSLILNGHIDVVPPAAEELWARPPFAAAREGDWLYGRGAGDMKAGLAAMAGAVRALSRAGYAPLAPVQLQSVVEEECTGHGALQCLLDGARADACVITEPHPDHLTTAQVGVLWFHVDIAGVPAHAARASRLGVGAVEAACAVLAALRRLERRLNEDPPPPFDALEHPINLNPGVISGGDWPSTVAATCTLSCRIGLYPGQSPDEMRALVEGAVAEAASEDPRLAQRPPRVRYDGFACEGAVVDGEEPVVRALAAAYERVRGERPGLEATTATTDARHFVRAGIPAVCFGPRAENIHGIDERVSLRSVVETAQVLGLFIRDWCGLVRGPGKEER
ncbi:acetylornithine deacetylase or succinyl-diaminopimelate desuccinylase [Rubrobacter xylanophilus DSM 9941]|uniref:Acetylornithine deacetylase or succinyl-diaminopimelate desuccinylase n=1 Tax=Rubrobacter xylanophilus (strain DSM 9941 / JCM 11954 / NBRC 16129 / PRD-1) TaxID=266117 RepID=Q1AX76_RUBXD|nr:ArgE/DapE family deacylase [Rubrobacter xylanophilus]ABG04002.1 acetylornithine deacetylase or succinyl-diaminopimelate desuccinylase [Rubrobacter xylanophilus DSM 9941]